MKNFFFLFLIPLFITPLFSQKAKKEKVKVEYTRLPAKPLNPEFTTYTASVYGSSSSLEAVGFTREGLIDQYLTLRGFKKLKTGGHFRIAVRVGYLRIITETSKSQKKTKKEKDGTSTSYTVWKKYLVYTLPITYNIEDHEGNSIANGTVTAGNYDYTSSEYRNLSELNKYWSSNRGKLLNNFRKERVREGLTTIRRQVKHSYDFSKITDNQAPFFVMKKSDADKAFIDAYERVKNAFANMKAGEPVDAIKTEIRPSLEFWMEKKDSYNRSDKKEKQYVFASLYNLTTAFYYLDELDVARDYANECLKLELKDGSLKAFLRKIEDTRKLMEANNTTTRHIAIDLENATPPASNKFSAVQDGDEEENAGTEIEGYVLFPGDKKVEGKFAVAAGPEEELVFGPEGNISFSYIENNRSLSHKLAPEEIAGFGFTDREFVVGPFFSGTAKEGDDPSPQIMEALYSDARISVYKCYPYNSQLGNAKIEYAYQKSSEETPVSLSSSLFLLFNKGLAKYFEDCPDLSEAAKGGEFKKEESDIIRAGRVYAELCE